MPKGDFMVDAKLQEQLNELNTSLQTMKNTILVLETKLSAIMQYSATMGPAPEQPVVTPGVVTPQPGVDEAPPPITAPPEQPPEQPPAPSEQPTPPQEPVQPVAPTPAPAPVEPVAPPPVTPPVQPPALTEAPAPAPPPTEAPPPPPVPPEPPAPKTFSCPLCSQPFSAIPSDQPKVVICPNCNEQVTIG